MLEVSPRRECAPLAQVLHDRVVCLENELAGKLASFFGKHTPVIDRCQCL